MNRNGISLTPLRHSRISRLIAAILRTGRGVSLIELIIGLAIASLIAGAAVVAIHQILTASAQANDMQLAISQVRAAEHWMTRDILTAQSADTGEEGEAVFLRLIWTDVNGVNHSIQYILEPMPSGSLNHIKRSLDDGTPTLVASYIDSDPLKSSWQLVDPTLSFGALRVTLTATARSYTATRAFDAMPRSD